MTFVRRQLCCRRPSKLIPVGLPRNCPGKVRCFSPEQTPRHAPTESSKYPSEFSLLLKVRTGAFKLPTIQFPGHPAEAWVEKSFSTHQTQRDITRVPCLQAVLFYSFALRSNPGLPDPDRISFPSRSLVASLLTVTLVLTSVTTSGRSRISIVACRSYSTSTVSFTLHGTTWLSSM